MPYINRKTIGALAGCLPLIVASSAFAASAPVPVTTTENVAKSTISIGTEILDGDTTYRIGYPVTMNGKTYEGYFPISELKWPLDVVMGRLAGSATFSNGWRLKGYLKKNMTEPSGNMKDSDWTTVSDPSRLDIYSESSISSFDAFIADIDIEYTFAKHEKFSIYGGLGYQYQNFSSESNLIRQYSPSGLPGFDYTGDGSVSITYEITYHMPYAILGTDIQVTDNFSLTSSLAYSPYVKADDEDHHLLREYGGKIAKSDMDGSGIMFNISGKYNFTPVWYAELGFQATKIDVDGTMDQSYGWFGYFASNKVEAESSQISGFLNIGANF